MTALSAIVLAGGSSRRMGCDKAGLRLAGRSLLDRALELVEPLCDDVVIVGPTEAPRPRLVALPDEVPGVGPLGGLCTGLGAVRGARAICVGVDQPFLTSDLLEQLVAASRRNDAAVFKLGRYAEPFPGVYATRIRPTAQKLIAEQRYRLVYLLEAVRTAYIPLEPTEAAREAFLNINTPEAFERARRLARQRSRSAL